MENQTNPVSGDQSPRRLYRKKLPPPKRGQDVSGPMNSIPCIDNEYGGVGSIGDHASDISLAVTHTNKRIKTLPMPVQGPRWTCSGTPPSHLLSPSALVSTRRLTAARLSTRPQQAHSTVHWPCNRPVAEALSTGHGPFNWADTELPTTE